jgi:transcription initiation factor TFIID subunit 13
MSKRPVQFQKEIRQLFYGFGDDINPLQESVEVMDEMLDWFIADLCKVAQRKSSTARVKTSDFLAALNQDPKKLGRAHELLHLDKELRTARAAFDVQEMTKGQEPM